MNCFCGMVDRRKAFSLISSLDHCQRSSPSRISDTPRAGFEPVQNLSSGFVEWSCAIVITTTPRLWFELIELIMGLSTYQRQAKCNCESGGERVLWTFQWVLRRPLAEVMWKPLKNVFRLQKKTLNYELALFQIILQQRLYSEICLKQAQVMKNWPVLTMKLSLRHCILLIILSDGIRCTVLFIIFIFK